MSLVLYRLQRCAAFAVLTVVLLVFVLALGACGDDDDDDSAETDETAEASGEPQQNACPPDGCQITVDDVEAEGDELEVRWTANFLPDTSQNHIHVYWDVFTAAQVSDDAADRGVEQGEWHLTDSYPTYVTESAASVQERGESTMLCVTAGDRSHNVLDPELFDCVDVADLL